MTAETWQQLMLRALCAAYKIWGGDCAEFLDPKQAANLVLAAYARGGVPTFSSAKERNAFLENLGELKALLAMPENSLPATQTDDLDNMIENLLSAIP